MKNLFLLVGLFIFTPGLVAQELIQIIPNCDHSNFANDFSPDAKPQILKATKELRPTILKKVPAKYTKEALELGIHGTVLVDAVFQTDGKIGQVRILRGLPNGLNQQVIEAANQLVFEPAIKEGVPVSVRMRLEFDFNILKLDKKRIENILRNDFKFLSSETRQRLTENYAKLKLGSKELDLRPLRDEAIGVNLLELSKHREYMQLREDGISNLCPPEQEIYRKLVGEMPDVVANPNGKFSEGELAYKVQRLFGLRYSGITTLTIEKQKKFVELYNEAVLLGTTSVKK